MVVTVGADQLGEHLRVTRIRLRPRRCVPVSIPRRRWRVDRVHDIAGFDERLNPQAAVGLDPDDHLARIVSMPRHEFMQDRDPTDPFGHSARSQLLAGFVARKATRAN